MFMFIGCAIFIATENIAVKICVILVSILLVIGTILYTRKTTIDIIFLADNIKVNYVFGGREERIKYEDLIQLKYISASRSTTTNRIKFKVKDEINSLKFRTVAYSNEFINFVKWIKSKNENIEISVFPSDNYMNHLLQEEYGFNYRKVPKIK
jgi:hypothetical protein